jgi:NADH dehydrogenase [ubiquinone] 1 alpha subcomplex assembly factor 1
MGPLAAPPIATIAGAAPARDNADMSRELFRFEAAASVADWSAIDDSVMGGVSRSHMRHDPAGHAVFEGIVSLENRGGFASVRSRPLSLGVPGAVAYLLEVRGDGKRFKLNLRTNDDFDGVNYQAEFEAPAGTWTRVRLAVSEFRPTFRGRHVPGAPPLDPARVRQLGLMIADRQAGSFALALRSIVAE